MRQPDVSVCVLVAKTIKFCLNGTYQAKGVDVDGEQIVEYHDGGIEWNGNVYQELTFIPQKQANSFSIYHVVIGINFHWERNETQVFSGALKIIADDGKLCAVNILPVEDYLVSVISSEMKATSTLEFLKAHAVISRSWLLAQMKKRKKIDKDKDVNSFLSFNKSDHKLVRWYDRQDHLLFDVCADDHCQRYQGITRASNQTVVKAVTSTRGQVLKYGDDICDTRFAKCCGGMMERFSTCWENIDMPYLQGKKDYITERSADNDNVECPDLTDEKVAEKWILSNPRAFCNTRDKRILAQVLNNYDQETTDFYRWTVEYSQEDLKTLIESKLKMTFGDILDLKPQNRGTSGRISLLEIIGSERSFIVGKELEIRRVLSESHLYSSAFIIQKVFDDNNKTIPSRFIIKGAGWGHGVGLCQIGAAVMGEKGYNYQNILQHYYPTSHIDSLYK